MYKLIPLSLILLLVACSESTNDKITSQDGEVISAISANNEASEKELKEELKEIEEEENKRIAEEKAMSTTLEFDKLKHDYGDVKPDSDNKTVFTVTNTGSKPLVIENVSASCGCTTPIKPEKPIAPGESDVIEVIFHPKPSQLNEIKKTVTVTANTMEKIHLLESRAFVKE